MDNNRMDDQELISALADGQLQGEAFACGVRAATSDARSREAWTTYHAVGEVLRTGRLATGRDPEAFLAKLQQRLRDEQPAAAPVPAAARAVVRAPQPAANDWIWKIAAGVASVAAVAAVGWNVWTGGPVQNAQPQLAVAPATPPAAAAAASVETATMMRDARLDQFLAAHRQFGGAGALQTSSGFLRNATFEAPGR